MVIFQVHAAGWFLVIGLLEDCIGVCEFQLPAFCQQEEEVAIRIILSDTMLP